MPIKPENWRILTTAARASRVAPYGTRTCSSCGTYFSPYRKRSMFCGRNCRRRNETKNKRAKKTCKECGISFTPVASNKGEFCSPSCKRCHQAKRISADPRRAESRRERIRLYSKSERYRFSQANAKSIRRQQEREGGVTYDEWMGACEKYHDRCAYCRSSKKLTMDHVLPISRGGKHVIENIVPACQPCNSSKGTSDWTHKLCP